MKPQVILPKRPIIDPRKMKGAIVSTLNGQAKAIKVDFDVTTQTWNSRPAFKISSPSEYTREISTDDDIYAMLNEGTKRHPITARNKPFLVFRWNGFRSKTIPNEIRSRKGAKGKDWAKKVSVTHPGTAARNWNKVIAKKWQERIGDIFQRAVDSAVKER